MKRWRASSSGGCKQHTTLFNFVYTNTGMLEGDDPREALEGFKQVVDMESEKGEW